MHEERWGTGREVEDCFENKVNKRHARGGEWCRVCRDPSCLWIIGAKRQRRLQRQRGDISHLELESSWDLV